MADRNELIQTHILHILPFLLKQLGKQGAVLATGSNGVVYNDDVSTHHLLELLATLDAQHYRDYIERMIESYPKDLSSVQNPFLISNLVIAGYQDIPFAKGAISALLERGRLPNGLFTFYTGYLHGGDHFSTLWAAKILSQIDSQKYQSYIETALDRCILDIDVLKPLDSHTGFLLLDMHLSKNDKYSSQIVELVDAILNKQQDSIWDGNAISTAYVVEDLLPFLDQPKVRSAVDSAVDRLFDLHKESANDLPELLAVEQQRMAESLFLQTLSRVCLVGTFYLRQVSNIDMGTETVRNIVGQHSYLSGIADIAKRLQEQVSDVNRDYNHLNEALSRFWQKHPYEKNVFVMMRYVDEIRFDEVIKTLREQFAKHGLTVHLAKDHQLSDDLWDNICIYMIGSKYGVVVFEQAEKKDFNPNVSLELGFMLSRGKRVLLLKEQTLTALPTDVVGKLYKPFNIGKPESIRELVDEWVSDVVQ